MDMIKSVNVHDNQSLIAPNSENLQPRKKNSKKKQKGLGRASCDSISEIASIPYGSACRPSRVIRNLTKEAYEILGQAIGWTTDGDTADRKGGPVVKNLNIFRNLLKESIRICQVVLEKVERLEIYSHDANPRPVKEAPNSDLQQELLAAIKKLNTEHELLKEKMAEDARKSDAISKKCVFYEKTLKGDLGVVNKDLKDLKLMITHNMSVKRNEEKKKRAQETETANGAVVAETTARIHQELKQVKEVVSQLRSSFAENFEASVMKNLKEFIRMNSAANDGIRSQIEGVSHAIAAMSQAQAQRAYKTSDRDNMEVVKALEKIQDELVGLKSLGSNTCEQVLRGLDSGFLKVLGSFKSLDSEMKRIQKTKPNLPSQVESKMQEKLEEDCDDSKSPLGTKRQLVRSEKVLKAPAAATTPKQSYTQKENRTAGGLAERASYHKVSSKVIVTGRSPLPYDAPSSYRSSMRKSKDNSNLQKQGLPPDALKPISLNVISSAAKIDDKAPIEATAHTNTPTNGGIPSQQGQPPQHTRNMSNASHGRVYKPYPAKPNQATSLSPKQPQPIQPKKEQKQKSHLLDVSGVNKSDFFKLSSLSSSHVLKMHANLIESQFFLSDYKVSNHFGDKLTTLALKSKYDYMVVQEKKGYSLIKQGDVISVDEKGKLQNSPKN